jgi:hypothetical protein
VIAVVHLVWGPLGPTPLRTFLDSYKTNASGVDHELVVVFNGVSDAQRAELMTELEGIEHRLLTLEERVQDLTAYAWASHRLRHERVCFMNSYSVILAPDWLAKLDDALSLPGAGMVGATGSWGSFRSAVLNSLRLPNPYRGVPAPSRRRAREIWCENESRLAQKDPGRATAGTGKPTLERLMSQLKSLRQVPEHVVHFEGFPAQNLRSNAFMADRGTFTSLHVRPIKRKMDAVRMECGRASFTSQIHARGKRTLVVTRDGSCYDRDTWPSSRTFWQGDQERLMIADNQTASYAEGDLDCRRLLAVRAWGASADPSPPSTERR